MEIKSLHQLQMYLLYQYLKQLLFDIVGLLSKKLVFPSTEIFSIKSKGFCSPYFTKSKRH